MCMDAAFINERITKTKEMIVAYEDAALAFATNDNIQSYTIDTGQTRDTVTRADLDKIQQTIDTLYNRCAVLEARLTGNNVSYAAPCF